MRSKCKELLLFLCDCFLSIRARFPLDILEGVLSLVLIDAQEVADGGNHVLFEVFVVRSHASNCIKSDKIVVVSPHRGCIEGEKSHLTPTEATIDEQVDDVAIEWPLQIGDDV